jgi:hypothetical protein
MLRAEQEMLNKPLLTIVKELTSLTTINGSMFLTEHNPQGVRFVGLTLVC